MSIGLIINMAIFVAVVVLWLVVTLLDTNRRAKYRNSQYEYEKAVRNHPAGKGLRSEEDILNDR